MPAAKDDQPARFNHALLVDGQVVGHWRHVPKARSVVIETALYRPLRRAETSALDAAVERYGAFLGVTVSRLAGKRSDYRQEYPRMTFGERNG